MTIVAYDQTELTTTEQSEFERCEQTIDHLRQAFTDAGAALATIREQRLYREKHPTFEDYCQQRWGFSRVQAHRLIQAAEVASHLLPIGNIVGLPENESQVRPLTQLETPEEQQDAWQEAVERSGGNPTGKIVQQVVQERTQPAAQERPALPPGWYWQDSSQPADIIAINGQQHDQISGFCETHEVAAAKAWELHQASKDEQAWADVAQAAADLAPPVDHDAFENAMAGALDVPVPTPMPPAGESNVEKMRRYGFPPDLAELLDREHWRLLGISLQPGKFRMERGDSFGTERHEVSIAELQQLFAPLLPQPEAEAEPEEEAIALPDGWKLWTFENGTYEAYATSLGVSLQTSTHQTEEAAIREALLVTSLYERLAAHGWKPMHVNGKGWHLQRWFAGDNAHGELEEFLYTLEQEKTHGTR